jgi:uncharacterized protein YgiM (DUF1202 family)
MKKIISAVVIILMLFVSITPNLSASASENKLAGRVSISSGWLNVRSGASTTNSVVASLTKGSYLTLISKSGSWWYVEYGNGKYGYCHADYISVESSKTSTVNITSGSLNIRSGAGTNYSRIGSLYKGEKVIVLSESSSWSKILFGGNKVGYVSSKYLSNNSSYPKVSLKVPHFMQNDSRWKNVVIGVSGKTIGQIGCATTGIAMMESFRTGITIYPDAMMRKLSYSSNGNVYWPTHFKVNTNSSGYLNAIYEQLKAGKPVLFGAKTSAGSQHWVVITGYQGGSTLTASGFTINDPGTATRTTLQHLLNSYPVFYKFFYY